MTKAPGFLDINFSIEIAINIFDTRVKPPNFLGLEVSMSIKNYAWTVLDVSVTKEENSNF